MGRSGLLRGSRGVDACMDHLSFPGHPLHEVSAWPQQPPMLSQWAAHAAPAAQPKDQANCCGKRWLKPSKVHGTVTVSGQDTQAVAVLA